MKLRKTAITAAAVSLVAAALVLPAFFTGEAPEPLAGPQLSALQYVDVQLNNGDLALAGMLFIPNGQGPFPAAVIIHGSGTSRRDNRWYLSITQYLQEKGVAVLLPDKRGSEKSGGDWVGADFETLAGDTLAAVDFIRNQELFPCAGVGLVGMSQGGWIAPVAADRDRDLAFVASVSGAAVSVRRQLVHEEIHNISRYTWPFAARLIAPLTAARILKMDHVRPYADFDPVPYWEKVDAPVFFAFGEGDENVPVDESVEVLEALSTVGLIRVYPDGGHAIRDGKTNRVQKPFLDDLAGFIKGKVLKDSNR